MKRLIILLLFTTFLFAQDGILIDEDLSDWENVSTMYSDPPDDGTGGNANIDFGNMWITNDDEYVYFRIQSGREITLVDYAFATNFMYLYIDTDNDPNTGKSFNGIGAELEYSLANRRGKTFINGERNVSHSDIGFLGAPTFSAKQFEFALRKDVTISGSPLFPNNKIKVVFAAFTSTSLTDTYDLLPDNSGFEYEFISNAELPIPDYSIRKTNPGYLRVMAYNIQQDGITDQSKTTEFHHIFDAIEPEIVGFTEVYDASSQAVADRLEFFLPSGEGQDWYNEKEVSDIIIVSRFQIKQSFPIDSDVGHDASGAFLLDLRPKYDSDMLVIVSHPKCCGGRENDDKRQNQFDAIIAFLRDAVNNGGDLTIQPNIPIVIMGDMNLVGDSRQYETLITGDIKINGNYGEDFAPDWDGGNLDDAKPYATNTNMTYTTNPGGFPPGRLDFIVYSGSVMEMVNSYIIDSKKLDSFELSQYGLSPDDTEVSDHLPVVADFDLSPITDIKKKDDAPKKFGLMQNYPNPFNPTTKIKFTIPNVETTRRVVSTKLAVYDILGRKIKTLLKKKLQPGEYEIEFDAADLPSGIYYYNLTIGEFSQTRKMLLIK